MEFQVLQIPLSSLRMILLLLLMTLFASCSSIPPPSRYNFTIAKPNCVDHCGDISIPFPFGTTPDCYLNRNFWLTCNQSGFDHPKLFWQNTSIELTDVSLDGQIKILRRIARDCYGPTGNRTSYSGRTGMALPYPHFRVNTTANKLTIVGNRTLGVAYVMRPNRESTYRLSCIATCDDTEEDLVNGSCYGLGCCQISIPEGVREINIGLTRFGNPVRRCNHAFLAEKTAFRFSVESSAKLMNVAQLPMVANWAIETRSRTCRDEERGPFTYACKSQYSTCYIPDNGVGYRCRCYDGYVGNPYLDDGCQDIDECQRNRCQSNSICVNMMGGYACRCSRGYYGDGKIGGFGCHRLSSKTFTVWTGVGIGIGSVLLVLLCFWFHKIIKKRADKKRKEKFFKRNGGILLQQQQTSEGTLWQTTKHFQAKELEKATDNFNESRILGQGGQGTVYKGMLANGQIVAIKKSKQVDEDQLEQLINEVAILLQINHRNVVKLLGCCLETEVPLLVYEFVPNGTLFDLIHDPNSEFQVSWNMRLKIAADIAGALAYLHSSSSLLVYHRDIKTSNILLDEKYVVKVSDFGTSKSLTVDQTHVTTLVKGTFGYLDPEYFQSRHFTEKSDVYSFGVVLLELLTGQMAVSMNRIEEEGSLVARFLMSMERDCVDEILDDQVSEQGKKKEGVAVARLAQRCLNLQGKLRPTMKEVATELESIRMSQMPVVVSVEYDGVVEDVGVREDEISEGKMTMISDFVRSWAISGRLGER